MRIIKKDIAFWFKHEPIELSSTHIAYIIDNPEEFGLPLGYIENLYKRYIEPFGSEGKAREEIIKYVAKEGWLRIRHYVRPNDYWSIQCDRYVLRKPSIISFCDWAIDNSYMSFNDSIKILAYDTGEFISYDFRDGGVSALYEDWESGKEKIKIIKIKEGMTNL